MITPAELDEHRTDAESRMKSRCAVMRKTGHQDQDPDTGAETTEWATVHADLPFRLGGSAKGSSPFRTVRIGDGEPFEVAVRIGHMPAATSDLEDGDLIEITAGENEGLVLVIDETTWQDQATARRVPVYEVPRPAEWE